MEKAIQKAIEGGYETTSIPYEHRPGYPLSNSAILLDRLFWQALGKSLGWNEECKACDLCGNADCVKKVIGSNLKLGWLHHWHRFIDHLAEGKNINSFFEELLSHE